MDGFEAVTHVTPYQQAEEYFGDDLRSVATWHQIQGVCVCTDAVFLLARPVRSDWPANWMEDIGYVDPDGDCWYIWWLGGSMEEALKLLHLSAGKPWLAYHRRGKFRIRPLAILATT